MGVVELPVGTDDDLLVPIEGTEDDAGVDGDHSERRSEEDPNVAALRPVLLVKMLVQAAGADGFEDAVERLGVATEHPEKIIPVGLLAVAVLWGQVAHLGGLQRGLLHRLAGGGEDGAVVGAAMANGVGGIVPGGDGVVGGEGDAASFLGFGDGAHG